MPKGNLEREIEKVQSNVIEKFLKMIWQIRLDKALFGVLENNIFPIQDATGSLGSPERAWYMILGG